MLACFVATGTRVRVAPHAPGCAGWPKNCFDFRPSFEVPCRLFESRSKITHQICFLPEVPRWLTLPAKTTTNNAENIFLLSFSGSEPLSLFYFTQIRGALGKMMFGEHPGMPGRDSGLREDDGAERLAPPASPSNSWSSAETMPALAGTRMEWGCVPLYRPCGWIKFPWSTDANERRRRRRRHR